MTYSPLAPQFTEAAIRECLDGTFTRVLYKDVNPRANWTPQDDDLLLQMRLRNKPFAEIAWVLERSEESVKKRFRMLRVKGGVR